MKNSVGFQFVVILCVCMQQLYAQSNFMNTLNHLDKIMVQTQVLRDIVQAEMAKQGIPSGPGAPPPSNVAYSSFVDEVAGRLQILEDTVSGLNSVMNRCHHQPPAPSPPTNVIAESATTDNVSSIVVRWDPPQPVPDNLQYKVYFAAVDESGYQPQGEVVFRICDATQTSASITDLSPRAHYQVRVGTVAGVVTESSSTPQVIETPDIIPSAPQNLRIEGTTPNTVTLRWDTPDIAGVVSSYVLYYREDGGGPQMTETVDPPTMFYTVNDLSEGTRYKFDVAAKSNNGEGPRSIPVEVKTIDFNPPHPLDLNCTAMNKTSVLLTWNKPLVLPGDGIIRGFNINYTDERYRDFFLFKTPTAEFTEAVISSLEPATVYYFQASSRTRKTFGGGGAVVMCQTKADSPSKPRNVQIELSRLDPPQLTIKWIPPYHTYGPLTNYTLHWGVKNGALRKEKIEPYRLRWDSDYLDDATVHEFKLFAVNAEGFGEPAIVQFTTPKRETIVPPNVTVDRVKGPNNTTMLRVKWDPPNQPVKGYRILYRKFEWVYTGRWKLKELNDPNALATEIVVDEPNYSHIVVVRGTAKRRTNPNFPMMGQMGGQMGNQMIGSSSSVMGGGRMGQGNQPMMGNGMMNNGGMNPGNMMSPMMGGNMNPNSMGSPMNNMGSMGNGMGSPNMNNMNPQMGNMNPQMGNMNSQMGNNMNPQMGNNMNPQMGNNMNPQMGNNMSPQMGNNMSPQMGNSMSNPMDGPNMGGGMNQGMRGDMGGSISSQGGPMGGGGMQMSGQGQNPFGGQMNMRMQGNQKQPPQGSQLQQPIKMNSMSQPLSQGQIPDPPGFNQGGFQQPVRA
ncbi:fibronectin type III domain-containing protein 2-like isoform X1 [Crassostrea angulata]|uniref:fibronectin type III domain-containing protein 2-like isoform X1 n=2 Tax=Magallana angulata TaxID=2784310 RepID=UPI0022B176BF|nr:fibronectin type III domain-containing protein 2-like isoform X1 [Crassostrea angulata]